MSCLVIKNDGIGDLILSSGLIGGLAREFAGELDLVTCEQNREIAGMIPGVRRVLYVSRDALRFSPRWGKWGILRGSGSKQDDEVLKKIRNSRYDVAISLRRFIRQNTLVLMRNVRARKKFCAWQFPTNATEEQARRSSRGWNHYQGPQEVLWEPAYYQGFIRDCLGMDMDAAPSLDLGAVDGAETSGEKSVALGIAGQSGAWPEKHWVALASQLAANGWRIGLFGGQESVKVAAQICQETGAANHAGKLSFRETAAELRRYPYYVGGDTGLSHFATLVSQKVLVILGGGTFRRFFPWAQAKNQHVIFNGMDCFDCDWSCKYPERYCLTRIQPRNVVEQLDGIVKGVQDRECDLNPVNERYSLGWRRSCTKAASGGQSKAEAAIRPDARAAHGVQQ
ncbi:MAG TPA: glycosyltransferase family 9 protein [Kiritimatiellia bacterium]|nr:glycosyltransferase family 9 protein [Kiritimatiellia bacterium]